MNNWVFTWAGRVTSGHDGKQTDTARVWCTWRHIRSQTSPPHLLVGRSWRRAYHTLESQCFQGVDSTKSLGRWRQWIQFLHGKANHISSARNNIVGHDSRHTTPLQSHQHHVNLLLFLQSFHIALVNYRQVPQQYRHLHTHTR